MSIVSASDRYLKLRKLAYEFAFCVTPGDFVDHWERHSDILQGCRMVLSNPSLASPLPAGLHERTFGADPKAYLNGFFLSSGLFFFSPELVRLHKSGEPITDIKLDFSVSLDSNVIGDIHKFMKGKSLDARQTAFLEMATYLRRNEINLDATPYLFENFQKAITDPKHFDFVVNGFATFFRFSTGVPLRENPESLSDFAFSLSEIEAHHHAQKVVSEMTGDSALIEEETRRLWHRLDSRYALLLTAIEYFGRRFSSLDDKLDWLLGTLEKDVGRIPEREFVFAFLAFAAPHNHPFFANQWPVPYNRAQNIVDLVRNMAWDLTFYRTMQTWATKSDRGDFAIPLFLTFDWKLAGLHDIYSCRLMLIDDHGKDVFCYSQHDIREVLQSLGLWNRLEQYFNEQRVLQRMAKRASHDDLAKRCREAEEELHQIIYARPCEKTGDPSTAK